MDRIAVGRLFVMALNAFGNYTAFVFFPGGLSVDIGVAVGAHDPLVDVNAGKMFRCLSLVTQFALNLAGFELMPHVAGKVGYVDMATGTAVLPVDGIGKSLNRNLVAVATEAMGRVNGHSLFGKSGQNPEHHQNQQRDNTAQA